MNYTAAQLFNQQIEQGPHRCFFCGGSCGEDVPSSQFIKSSFTGLDTVTFSPFVCHGCVASQNEQADIKLACGEKRSGQKVRGYSWILTETSRVAATKAHRQFIFKNLIEPPKPPFSIVLTDSGQKHLIYRSVVNWDTDHFVVGLETEQIQVDVSKVIERYVLVRSVCAVIGKPALTERLSSHSGMMLFEKLGQKILDEWLSVDTDPLTRLLVWLCGSRDACLDSQKKDECLNGVTGSI
jgi:CRISPR type IV-associated protein Csf1